MVQHYDLTGLALVALAALVCGIVMARLRQPAIVGYILAGVLLGPSGFGLVGSRGQVGLLADLGVLLLLFLVGMELSLRGFMGVWKTAVTTALLQIAASVGLMMLLGTLFGWSPGLALLLGFVVALSSTAVVVKILEQINILRGAVGQIIVGILIAQDLAVVPMILALHAVAEPVFDPLGLVKILLSVAFLAALTVYLSRRRRMALPFSRTVAGQFDLRPLSGLTYCFGAAALTGLAGLSPAYGAFLAGLVIGNSTARAAMIRSMRPIQSVLMMVFFLSIGLLMDLAYIWENLGTVLLLLLVVTVLKTALNIGILHLLREPWPHAFIAGVVLAQIGEFSFVLGQTGLETGLITPAHSSLIIAVAALSLLFSPLWQLAARRLLRIILLSVTSFKETVDLLGGPRATGALDRGQRLAGAARSRAVAAGEAFLARLRAASGLAARLVPAAPGPNPAEDDAEKAPAASPARETTAETNGETTREKTRETSGEAAGDDRAA